MSWLFAPGGQRWRFSISISPSSEYSGQKDHYYLGNNITSIALDENLFAADSHCMTNLKSATLGLYEKGTGRGVVCDIETFPYTLLWSKKGMPKFVCIEPWHSLPSCEGGSTKWEEKAAAAILLPGEAWATTLSMSFVR